MTRHKINPQEVIANREHYLKKIEHYKKFGFDHEKARDNIIQNMLHHDIKNILEIGTGKGYLTKELAKKFNHVITIDKDKNSQKIALLNAAYAQVTERIDFETADAEKLDYADYSFDAVISAFTFHHLKEPFKAIDEMIRVTKGLLIISDFNKNGFAILDKAHQSEGGTHEKENNDFDKLENYLKEKGFSITKKEDEWQEIIIAKRS